MFDDIETRYSYLERLEDMDNLEKENRIQNLELAKKNYTILYLSILGGVVLVSAIVLIPMFLAKRRLSKELQRKNEEMSSIIARLKDSEEALEYANADLQTKNINLYNSQEKLQELNATKDKFFSIIAHDLINPLASLKQLSEMLADEFHQMDSVDVEDYLVMIKGASSGVYNLLDNRNEVQLYPLTGNADYPGDYYMQDVGFETGDDKSGSYYDRPWYYSSPREINFFMRIDFR